MVAVVRAWVAGFTLLVALLAGLRAMADLDLPGLVVSLACGLVLGLLVAGHPGGRHDRVLGPADLVTLTRAMLACGVAALAVDGFTGPSSATPLVVVAAVALVLDAVDGRVARRTGTVSPFGARFDGEADAFLILVLSVYVVRDHGPWVLAIGAARYLFLLAGYALPWLRDPLPPRFWRKVVAAVQGVVLTLAAAGVAPADVTDVALVVALVLLAESFGRDVAWLWRRRPAAVLVTGRRGAPARVGLR
jgi:phosphatidylglycerophosphate synthase